jgi:NAD(P)H-hydrate epimerase
MFKNLIRQFVNCGGSILESLEDIDPHYNIIIDAVFGFGFNGHVRSPFDEIIRYMRTSKEAQLVAIDVPSGWQVDAENHEGDVLHPDMLISLTAPKQCAKGFQGRYHILGGRFVPL